MTISRHVRYIACHVEAANIVCFRIKTWPSNMKYSKKIYSENHLNGILESFPWKHYGYKRAVTQFENMISIRWRISDEY